jgi:hypothetical protein
MTHCATEVVSGEKSLGRTRKEVGNVKANCSDNQQVMQSDVLVMEQYMPQAI